MIINVLFKRHSLHWREGTRGEIFFFKINTKVSYTCGVEGRKITFFFFFLTILDILPLAFLPPTLHIRLSEHNILCKWVWWWKIVELGTLSV